ncbi:Membrane or secreted protein containing DUF1501 [Planctomycetales bacterium 10988]|nr:Membrane or secreted protein containing DUF1501 [Planctomycetales bacterium 10988]
MIHSFNNPTINPVTRREALKSAACGFGYLAFLGLTAKSQASVQSPLAIQQPHFTPKAKRVIFLFMDGGPSHMDTFDYKPKLSKDDGKEGRRKKSKLLGSPFKFKQHGESGLWCSELFPEIASKHIDDLCVIRSMHTDTASHPQAVPFLHTGSFQFTRPSVGSWILYGLGTENQNLPGFITINPPKILGGAQNYGNAFLPAAYQGTPLGELGRSVKNLDVPNIANSRFSRHTQREQLELVQAMNQSLLARREADAHVDGVINSLELGARMQDAVPEIMNLETEPQAMLDMYGIGGKDTDNFGRQCLLARRFAEAGVRYIELAHTNWDQHRSLTNTLRRNGRETDQPIAALMTDLKQRGMLEDTLIVWSGEFGRQPEIENGDGRGHNAGGYSLWMAGGGVKGGMAYGTTDDYGAQCEENPVHLHDLHATMLHLLGLDHERLTYRYSGRDFRLTDVHGRIVHDVLA